jgi:two-component system, OmpR family, phosphate regulon sensor histidine kinase PhoR
MRPRGSIISQLLVAFSALAVLVAVAAVVGYAGLHRQNSAARQRTGRDYALQQAAGRVQRDFTASQLSISGFALSGRSALLRPVGRSRADFAAQMAILRRDAPSPLRGLVTTQARAGTQLFTVASEIGKLPPASPQASGLARGTTRIAESFYAANSRLQADLAADVRQLTAASTHSMSMGQAWSAAAIAVAVTLVLMVSVTALRGITRPLRGLTATMRRLTSGEHAARANIAGSAEVREVAESVNTMADENDRLRRQEQEHARLRALAREAGIRVREPLWAEDVLREASTAITECVESDLAVLRLVEDDQPRYADCARKDWLPVNFLRDLSPDFDAWAHGLLATQSSTVIQDVPGPEGEVLPPSVREPLLRYGVVSHIATPFGSGSELYGLVELERTRPGQPWTEAEVDAIESIAADIGRGLKHARMYEAENSLVEQLKALDQTKSDFFATVSHELRTPLTSIEGYVEMLRDQDGGQTTAAQERMLETIDRNATRLRNLIEDLFTLTKIESGTSQSVPRPVNLLDIVRDAAQVLQPLVTSTGLTLTVTCPDGSLAVNGDVSQLDRVVMNLLSNAAKFTSPGGRIRVTAARDGDTAVVSVSDTGIGIPDKDKEAVFGRFFRASNAVRRSISGTGLGLTIVRTIVAEHGGEVAVHSTEGVGTTLTVRLPLLLASTMAAEQAGGRQEESSLAARPPRGSP